ncbi:MAG: hydroxypyruvate isomerase family protein [Intrasporangium sp.]|uniref:2-oxo-tetronate isomerase n=1 Tax=Intrasporangium sp. TaxID=1925024 RepID=UPI0026476C89|nr:2-oxo-tetronate isomerase [Intrasporangium sp.]MDN5797882.1 hydroxypyruvate isomerase family protein [Intrasporangium sp.]
MPKFAANLSMLFTELDFLDRFEAAANAGFEAVEFLFPYDFPAEQIAARLQQHGLIQALFNLPPGDWASGERGLTGLPGREAEFETSVETALQYADALGCVRLHAMAGIPGDDASAEATYVRNVQYAADRVAESGRSILLEPINPYDMPGYLLGSVRQVLRLLDTVDRDNVRLQLDLYHAQITDGDVTRLIGQVIDRVGHVQIAGVPHRHEPDTGELNYPFVLNALDETGYDGWVGCEYHPATETVSGLGWLETYRAGR